MDRHFILYDNSPFDAAQEKSSFAAQFDNPRGFGYRRLARFKTVNGRKYQLHATRGWKCVGRAASETLP